METKSLKIIKAWFGSILGIKSVPGKARIHEIQKSQHTKFLHYGAKTYKGLVKYSFKNYTRRKKFVSFKSLLIFCKVALKAWRQLKVGPVSVVKASLSARLKKRAEYPDQDEPH